MYIALCMVICTAPNNIIVFYRCMYSESEGAGQPVDRAERDGGTCMLKS